MTSDMLQEIFERQVLLQQRLGNMPFFSDDARQQYINIMTIALVDEIFEAIRETKFKPWKKQQVFNDEKFKEELIDAVHFMVNLCLASGMDAKEVHARFIHKNDENHSRQDKGY